MTHDELVEQIAGQPLSQLYPAPPQPEDRVALRVDELSSGEIRGVSLTVQAGEILGIAGISGSGRDALNRVLFGGAPLESGAIYVGAKMFRHLTPATAIDAGVGYLPADRGTQSAIPTMSVAENVTLPMLPRRSLGWLGARGENRDVLAWLKRLQVTPADPVRTFANLSGGNQQKAVLARWLRRGSRVLLLDEPTQGVDVSGKRAIYEALGSAARDGTAVVMASSDAEELAEVCERVLVLRGGRIAATLQGGSLRAETIVSESLIEPEAA